MVQALTYDDIQLVPDFSKIKTRTEIDLKTQVSRRYSISIPFIASPMDSICEIEMAYKMYLMGGIGCIHRFMEKDEQSKQILMLSQRIKEDIEKRHDHNFRLGMIPIMGAIGVQEEDKARAEALIENGANILLIDVAHGHHINVISMLQWLKHNLPEYVDVIVGNIATAHAAEDLEFAGADGLRVGIGGGCFTPKMKVKTTVGMKNISEINIGDVVYTHTGEQHIVISKIIYEKDEEIMLINDIECTKNHEFYVINKKHINHIKSDDDVHKYVEWVASENLTTDYLLVELELKISKMKLIEIKKIERKHYKGKVYDLTVEKDHSYNINGIIVHNSLCTTRIQTGFGVPNVTAIENIVSVAKTPIIADGGIRSSGDIAKALSLGASCVMLGSLLSGTEETPGTIIETPNGLYKRYRGAASLETKITYNKETRNVEGESTIVPFKGGVKFILNGLIDGVKSALSYNGSENLNNFRPKYVMVTNAGIQESKPHLLK